MGFQRMLIILFTVLFATISKAQLHLDTLGWRPPVEIPIVLSGNFAELRADHFHAGIDIKTQGQEGLKIFAVQDGYISRIKISPMGYGKSIYIMHPDGFTSVYAHLKELNIQLEKYIRNIQYQRESYEVDVYPNPNELVVKKGEIIALSGNSGSSAGPHLHFEIRDSKTSKPLNGLFLGFKIPDHIAPQMGFLYVYEQDANSSLKGSTSSTLFHLKKTGNRYKLLQGDTLQIFGNVGFGLKVDDLLDGAANLCGVYQLQLWVDDTLFFEAQFDGVSFSESRYVNSLMDYAEFIKNKRKIYKLFVEPNNHLSVYHQEKNRGIIHSEPGKIKKIKIVATDANANKSELLFYLAGKQKYKLKNELLSQKMIPWQQSFEFDSAGVELRIPAKVLYDSVPFTFNIDSSPNTRLLSPVYSINQETVAIHDAYQLRMPFYQDKTTEFNKLLLVYVSADKLSPLGGSIINGKLEINLRGFGPFAVAIDTIAPVIKPKNGLAINRDLTSARKIQFEISDDLSGIKFIRGTINGKWVLFEWDPKNSLFSYEMDENTPKQGNFELKVVAVDAKDNKSVFQLNCFRNIPPGN